MDVKFYQKSENHPKVCVETGDETGVWDNTAIQEALDHAAEFQREADLEWAKNNPPDELVKA